MYRHLLLLSIAVLAFLLLVDPGVHARTWHVPTECSSIQSGIDSSATGDTVLVAEGIYPEHIDLLGKAITLASRFVLDDLPTHISNTVIDGALAIPDTGSVVSCASGEDLATVICGFTIQNGISTWGGGGIRCAGSSPRITNCVIRSCEAGAWPDGGGGIGCIDESSPEILDCTIEANTANGYGGGIGCFAYSSPLIQRCEITDNVVADGHIDRGGGVYIWNYCNPVILDCWISGNRAIESGGGVYCYRSAPTIRRCEIDNNESDTGAGLFLHYRSDGIVVEECVVHSNTSTGRGGGIWTGSLCTGTISNCVIYNNVAESGGGVYCFTLNHTLPSSFDFVNCTITGNTATNRGGGFMTDDEVYPRLLHSILWDNTAPVGPEIAMISDSDPSELDVGCCDVEGGESAVYVEPSCLLHWLDGNIDSDPLFCDATAHNFRLQEGSPCRADNPVNPYCDLIGALPVGCDPSSVNHRDASTLRVAPRFVAAFPNPFSEGTTVIWNQAHPGQAELAVLDVRGRVIRVLSSGRMGVGEHRQIWDGRDRQGKSVPGGVYWIKVQANKVRSGIRVLRVR
ncbi:right-handed parallel beta-helix repeat-containing protein [Candidatus Eisenbacteria bacterium]|uniref:Right-handed parallel beta-helix repeat-containing protein n=1 Tax=Eiseniibacteriota bacterium TaxID=2212470 RepID=A0ABV6YLE5_UNCEI